MFREIDTLSLSFGLVMIVASAILLWAATRHFGWLQRYLPILCHWGWPKGWPASRESVMLGASAGFPFGLLVIFGGVYPVLKLVGVAVFLLFLMPLIFMAAWDYKRSH